jgi:hypothetical protein
MCLGFVATEEVDVLLYPLQGHCLIVNTKVQSSAIVGYGIAIRI